MRLILALIIAALAGSSVLAQDAGPLKPMDVRAHYNTVRPHSALGYRPPAPETIIPLQETPTMN